MVAGREEGPKIDGGIIRVVEKQQPWLIQTRKP
jgi:hypothetical protein